MSNIFLDELAIRFSAATLPTDLASDACVTNSKYQYPRYGTNLMTTEQAKAFLSSVLQGYEILRDVPEIDDCMNVDDQKKIDDAWEVHNTAQTTTQRTAKHRLAVKERMARYEGALFAIMIDCPKPAQIAREALNPTDPAKS